MANSKRIPSLKYSTYNKVASSMADSDLNASEVRKDAEERRNNPDSIIRRKMRGIMIECESRQEAYKKILDWLDTLEGQALTIESKFDYVTLAKQKVNSNPMLKGKSIEIKSLSENDKEDEER